MGSKRAAPKGKKIKPTFWVFCEGETEAAYIAMLRSQYRIPIEITTKVAGNSITEKYINKCKQGRFTHKKDKDLRLPNRCVSTHTLFLFICFSGLCTRRFKSLQLHYFILPVFIQLPVSGQYYTSLYNPLFT